jgi:hypothetical protein
MDAIDQLQRIVNRFPPGPGRRYSWLDLMRRGVLRTVPPDPTGVPFELDPDTGVVTVSEESELFPMPNRRSLTPQ